MIGQQQIVLIMIVYDGDGNRVSETVGGVTTQYLIDDRNPTGLPQVLDEIVSGAVTRTYAYGLQRISEDQQISGAWTPSFYGYDGHGNVRFLTSNAGAITDSRRGGQRRADRILTIRERVAAATAPAS